MLIEVFGPGCARCKQTALIMTIALERLGVSPGGAALVSKIDDLRAAAMRGVLTTPAVAIDGRLVSQGKVPTVEEATAWIQAAT